MDAGSVRLVQQSWKDVLPIGKAAGELFYRNLFEADPSLRALFRGNIDEQAAKLVQMIDVAVGKLDDPDVLMPVLHDLGKRHSAYGVSPDHYGTVGAALLKTLEQGLGDRFTADTRAAWASVYGVMAHAMAAHHVVV